ANNAVAHFDGFAAVSGLRMQDANVIAIIPVLNLFPFHWDVQLFNGHSLKGVRFCQRYPDAGLPCDLWKFNAIDKLELIRAFDNAGLTGSANRKRAGQKNNWNSNKACR